MSNNDEVVNRGLRDDKERKWEQVQIKAFKIWINSYLNQKGLAVENIEEDFKSGVNLCTFLESATKKKLPRWTAKPSMRVHKIENLSIALHYIQKDLGVRLVSIGAEDLVDGKVNLTLGLLWSLFRRLRIETISEEGKSSEDGLLTWIKKMTAGYDNVNITNFRDSFNDGMAFSALIHAMNPDVIDFDGLDVNQPEHNLIQAFEIAEAKLGIPKLLDAEDLLSGNADERSVTLYTSLFFHAYVADEERRKLQAQFKENKTTVAEKMAALETRLQTETEEKEKYIKLTETLEEEQRRLNEALLEKERESNSRIAALEQRIRELLEEIAFLKEQRIHETEMRFLLEDKIGILEMLLDEKNEENRVKSTENSEERLRLIAELEEIKKRSKEVGGEIDDLEQENKRLLTDAEEKARRLNEMEERRNKLLAEINALKDRVNKEIELRNKKTAELESLKRELETLKAKQIVQNQARIGLDVLKKNLEEHLEDLYRWRDLHEVEFKEGLEDFDLNKVISDLSAKSFEDQLSYLDGKLQEENKALSRIVKLKDSKEQLSDTIIKAGWLVMKGRKEWKKRWFKLSGDRLTYYEDDATTDIAGMIQLDQGCEVLRQKALKDEENPAKKLWPLKVTVGDRKLFIRAANKKERHSWFLVLTSKIAHLNYVKATEDAQERPDTRIIGTFAANKVPALNLSHRSITDAAISALVKGLPGRDELEDLILESSEFNDQKLAGLCEVIEKLQIKTFNFSNNSLKDITKFAQFLSPVVTSLKLSHNQLTAESIAPLIKSIKSNQNISALELHGNPLGPEGAKVLASEFGNLSFPHLNLSSTNLGDAGVQELSSLLSSKPFTKINLSKNNITDKGVEILVNALKDSQVEDLDLSNNNFGSEGAAHVRSLLKSNQNLMKVNLSGNAGIITGESLASLLSSGDFKLPDFTLSRV